MWITASEISNRFAALEYLSDSKDINTEYQNLSQRKSMSAQIEAA